MVFPVVMYRCESSTIKKSEPEELMLLNCAGEDSWEFLGKQGDQTSHPKGNQPWIFIGRTDAEAEAPILWQPDAKNWLIEKDPNAGKDWRHEKGTTEDEVVGWHHRLDGHKFEQALRDSVWRRAWHAAVHGVAKSQIRLSDWTELISTMCWGSYFWFMVFFLVLVPLPF